MAVMVLVVVSGCGGRKSSLLLERNARGPLDQALLVGKRVELHAEPVWQTETQEGIDIAVTHASREFLNNFFKNKDLFGDFAGRNPYYKENLVFYIEIANRSDQKIFVNPGNFVIVDDQGNQYNPVGMDYVTALGEARAPFSTATRGVIEEARPGYFGLSLPVGKIVSAKPQGQFALLKQSALQAGVYYPGVSHDGIVAFWNPSSKATTVRLMLYDIKTQFDPSDIPQRSLNFAFEFAVSPLDE